eukprot:Clim_evm19s168 gene=Clim_evmTU19s168
MSCARLHRHRLSSSRTIFVQFRAYATTPEESKSTKSEAKKPHWFEKYRYVEPEDKKQKRLQEQAEIHKEIRKGYFADFGDINKQGGKLSVTKDATLTKANDSVALPGSVLVKNLNTGTELSIPDLAKQTLESKWQPLLVAIVFRDFAMKPLAQWRQKIKESGLTRHARYVEISLVDKAAYRPLRWLVEKSLKSKLGEDRSETFYVGWKGAQEVAKALESHNQMIPYICLVDRDGRIRWKAHAMPEDSEVIALQGAVRDLIQRQSKGHKSV